MRPSPTEAQYLAATRRAEQLERRERLERASALALRVGRERDAHARLRAETAEKLHWLGVPTPQTARAARGQVPLAAIPLAERSVVRLNQKLVIPAPGRGLEPEGRYIMRPGLGVDAALAPPPRTGAVPPSGRQERRGNAGVLIPSDPRRGSGRTAAGGGVLDLPSGIVGRDSCGCDSPVEAEPLACSSRLAEAGARSTCAASGESAPKPLRAVQGAQATQAAQIAQTAQVRTSANGGEARVYGPADSYYGGESVASNPHSEISRFETHSAPLRKGKSLAAQIRMREAQTMATLMKEKIASELAKRRRGAAGGPLGLAESDDWAPEVDIRRSPVGQSSVSATGSASASPERGGSGAAGAGVGARAGDGLEPEPSPPRIGPRSMGGQRPASWNPRGARMDREFFGARGQRVRPLQRFQQFQQFRSETPYSGAFLTETRLSGGFPLEGTLARPGRIFKVRPSSARPVESQDVLPAWEEVWEFWGLPDHRRLVDRGGFEFYGDRDRRNDSEGRGSLGAPGPLNNSEGSGVPGASRASGSAWVGVSGVAGVPGLSGVSGTPGMPGISSASGPPGAFPSMETRPASAGHPAVLRARGTAFGLSAVRSMKNPVLWDL